MATGGNIQSLGSILADVDRFEIPDFQRNYSWETGNVSAFYKDITHAVKKKNTFYGFNNIDEEDE